MTEPTQNILTGQKILPVQKFLARSILTDGGSTGIRIHIFTLVSISGHRYANDMVKSMLER